MKEGGTLIKEGARWFLKDGKRYEIASTIQPDAEFHQAPVEQYILDGSGKVVIGLIALNMEDNPVEFKAKPQSGASSHSGTSDRRGGDHRRPQDRDLQSQKDKSKHDKRREEENQDRFDKPAFAPYNFVPLNTVVVQSPDAEERFSGYLDVLITALTPFFIGNENPSQLDQRSRNLPKPFFQMGQGPFVPGSAFRGLTRSMVEIVSWSAMTEDFFTNKKLSFRAVAERGGRQRDEYRLTIPANRELTDIKAGYLRYNARADAYFIYVAQSVDRFDSTEDASPPEWNGSNCFVRSGKMPPNPRTGKGGKKQQWKLSAASQGNPLPVPPEVYKNYRDDATRHKRFDVFKEAKTAKGDTARFGYPVFFNTDASGEVVLSIGHTAYYRLPYSKSIGDHIPQTAVATGDDFAHSIFGTTQRAGRVWFEDCHAVPATIRRFPPVNTQLLMGPKPTSFQHYLEQPAGILTPMDELRHWGDDEAPIRGHKLYWHRFTPHAAGPHSWIMERLDNAEARGTDQAKIQPLHPGAQFKGRIRFDQLTAAELGAVLFALELPANMAHKLGYAKPLGLGSVRISIGLTLIDRKKRYMQVIDEDGNWNLSSAPAESKPFKDAFTKAVAKQLGTTCDTWESWWAHERLQELAHMLQHDASDQAQDAWLEATRYMRNKAGRPGQPGNANEYATRPVLPHPGKVIELYKKNRPKKP